MSALKPNGRWGTSSVDTSESGATWVSLPDVDCDEVLLVNTTGVTLGLRSSEATLGIKLPDAYGPAIPVSGNAREVQVRRFDESDTPVTVGFIWRRY